MVAAPLSSEEFLVAPLQLAGCQARRFFWGGKTQAAGLLAGWTRGHHPRVHVSLNANALYWARKNKDFGDVLREADLATPDGDSILLMGKWLGFPVAQKIAGIELADSLLALGRRQRWGVCFVGRRTAVLTRLDTAIRKRYPGLPFFIEEWRDGPGFAQQLGERIRGENIRVLLAALPMPTQEVWLWQNRHVLGAPVSMGVGGAFEVWAGLRRRAPDAWQRAHLEWLYRFLQQPLYRFKPAYRATLWLGAQLIKRHAKIGSLKFYI